MHLLVLFTLEAISMDEAGVEQACRAFWKKDLFYLRLGGEESGDEELWRTLMTRFMATSHWC
jgi:hypothetical protein